MGFVARASWLPFIYTYTVADQLSGITALMCQRSP